MQVEKDDVMIDILVVEDNEEIGGLLSDFLEAEGYDVYLAVSGEEALELYEAEGAKMVLLDIMLPGIDGFFVCQKIRQKDNTPILIISAKSEKQDMLKGLFMGADDYIEKPYDIDILLAKIKSIFKRRYATDEIVSGNIRCDRVARKVYLDGELVPLNVKEYALLLYLMENQKKVLKKEELFAKIWGFDSESEMQTLTVHMNRLKSKLEKDPKNPEHFITIWGVGYRYE